jgi:hypothetical protein
MWLLDWGIPVRLRSDGGPQFRTEFSQFCEKKGIIHEVSSPYHSASNGHAEAAVKNVKYLLQKCDANWSKFQDALLEWRNTPRADGVSPAQMMVGRRQRTSLPLVPECYKQVESKTRQGQSKEKSCPHTYTELLPGMRVIVQNIKSKRWDTYGTISSKRATGRSYYVEDDEGVVLLRNGKFLRPLAASK